MVIRDLQDFLKSLGSFVAAQQGKAGTIDIDLLIAGLEPFSGQTLTAFLQILVTAQGIDPATISGLGGKVKKPAAIPNTSKTSLKSGNDLEAIQTAFVELDALYQRAAEPTLSYDDILNIVKKIQDRFDQAGFKEVAKKFGLLTGISTKKGCLEKIIGKINDRKGSFERGQAIAKAAQATQTY